MQKRQAAADHRRGRRGRGPGDAGGQQAARHPAGRGRQGAGLRRPPQGDARGHRRPDRRQGDLQGPRHQARERHARTRSAAAKKVKIDNENTTIIEGAGGEGRDRGPDRADPAARSRTDSDYDREKLQERLAKLAGGVAQIKVGGRHRDRDEGAQGPVEDALHATRAPGRGGRRRRRRRGPAARARRSTRSSKPRRTTRRSASRSSRTRAREPCR